MVSKLINSKFIFDIFKFESKFQYFFPFFCSFLYIPEDEVQFKEIFVPLMTNPTESTENLNEPIDESHADFWRKNAQDYLKSVLEDPEKEIKSRNAKNIILFLGDGMSLSTVAATRMYLGNENKQLSFEKFPHLGLSKVGSFTSIFYQVQ